MDIQKKITTRYFRQKKEKGEKILALTAYDAPTAKFAEECGVELLLVGDSLGMALLGYKSTIPVTIEQSLHHCAAVARGAKFAFIVGDMPFMTYHPSIKTAMTNAIKPVFQERPVVVRSSAVGEDASNSSFAGIHESYVNVRGTEAIMDHIKLVWASLWSDAAMLYRAPWPW